MKPDPADESPARAWKLRLGSWLASLVVRFVHWSNEVTFDRVEILDRIRRRHGPFLLAFWHEQILLMPYIYPGPRISVMISRHGDGEWIARTVARFGIGSVRGSTTTGGPAALRELVRIVRDGHDGAFTPDGPKGPRRRVQSGVILAARLTGAPILPVALAASRGRRLRSWDRFLLPAPFGRLCYAYGDAIFVPREAEEADVEAARRTLEAELERVNRRAEALAGGAV